MKWLNHYIGIKTKSTKFPLSWVLSDTIIITIPTGLNHLIVNWVFWSAVRHFVLHFIGLNDATLRLFDSKVIRMINKRMYIANDNAIVYWIRQCAVYYASKINNELCRGKNM
jgi:hypothetical protein